MNTTAGIFLLLFLLSLALNCFQAIAFFDLRANLDDVVNRLIRALNEVSDREDAIKRIHIMYQKELGKQRELFTKYYGEKRE